MQFISNSLFGIAAVAKKCLHTSSNLDHIMKLTRMRVVDNSTIGKQAMADGKPPRVIHVYRKSSLKKRRTVGTIGDKVLVAIKGEKKKGYIIGVKQKQACFVPRMDSNNIVLIDDSGSPLGTRIHAPIPSLLRGSKKGDFSKIIAIATRFV